LALAGLFELCIHGSPEEWDLTIDDTSGVGYVSYTDQNGQDVSIWSSTILEMRVKELDGVQYLYRDVVQLGKFQEVLQQHAVHTLTLCPAGGGSPALDVQCAILAHEDSYMYTCARVRLRIAMFVPGHHKLTLVGRIKCVFSYSMTLIHSLQGYMISVPMHCVMIL
jgi:hypothetical protein